MVCFNENQVYFHFDGKITITVESAFSYNSHEVISVPVKQSSLMGLLGASVSRVEAAQDGTLSFLFDNSQTLKLYDVSKLYESYSISHSGNVIRV